MTDWLDDDAWLEPSGGRPWRSPPEADDLGTVEIAFSAALDLAAFRRDVAGGRDPLQLWLVETESVPDFARFRGVDLTTWARVLIDAGPDFLFVTVPGGVADADLGVARRIAPLLCRDGTFGICRDGVLLEGSP